MLTFVKGSDPTIPVRIRDANDNPVDLTGLTVTVNYRKANASLENKSGANIVSVNAVLGEFNLLLNDTDTNALAEGDFNFDVLVDDSGITTIYKFEGEVTVLAGV